MTPFPRNECTVHLLVTWRTHTRKVAQGIRNVDKARVRSKLRIGTARRVELAQIFGKALNEAKTGIRAQDGRVGNRWVGKRLYSNDVLSLATPKRMGGASLRAHEQERREESGAKEGHFGRNGSLRQEKEESERWCKSNVRFFSVL